MQRLITASIAIALAAGMMQLPTRAQQTTSSRAALSEVIRELNVDSVSLGRTIDYLRDSSGANIVVNWKVLESVGVARETPISLTVHNLTLRKMLQLVLDQASPNAQLVYSIDSNVIQVTTQDEADRQMITKVYVVDDLVMAPRTRTPPSLQLGVSSSGVGGSGGTSGQGVFGGNSNSNQSEQELKTAQQRGDELADLIRQVIRPTIWRENGGNASIRFFSGKLIVTAPLSVHEAIGGPVSSSDIRFGS
jgi:hypothetical protein